MARLKSGSRTPFCTSTCSTGRGSPEAVAGSGVVAVDARSSSKAGRPPSKPQIGEVPHQSKKRFSEFSKLTDWASRFSSGRSVYCAGSRAPSSTSPRTLRGNIDA